MAGPVTQCMAAATLAVCVGGDTPAVLETSAHAALRGSNQVSPQVEATDLARDVITLAVDGGARSAGALRFADRVALGLGRHLIVRRDGVDLLAPSGWLVETCFFRSYIGPFSALRVIRNHVDDTSAGAADLGSFEVAVDRRPRCTDAHPPEPAPGVPTQGVPDGFEEHRRISIQPAAETIASCLLWFSIDLFLDADDRVAAVTLDLWEP